MNIDDAVKVLRKHEYRKKKTWALWADGMVIGSSAGQSGIVELTGFEAIAIAEKLERDAGRDMPATRKLMRVYKGFARDMSDCLVDGDVIMKNSAGELTFGDLRAAIHELEGKP